MDITITDIKDQLINILNPNAWDLDSTEGIITLVLTVFLIYTIKEKAWKFVTWCVGGLLLVQIFYLLGTTPIDNYIPFSAIFKYDILTSLAQLCVGTKLSDGLLWIAAWLRYVFMKFGDIVSTLLDKISILHMIILK